MITSRSASDIEDDIKECGKKGIVVFTADDLGSIAASTILPVNSNARYQEIREKLDSAKQVAKAENQKVEKLAKDIDDFKRGLSRQTDSPFY